MEKLIKQMSALRTITFFVHQKSQMIEISNACYLQACDAMFHLCRTFEDPEITHVEGEVDPVRDLDIINEELR